VVTYGHGLVLLWRLYSTLCTSRFVHDVVFVHNGLYVTWLRGCIVKSDSPVGSIKGEVMMSTIASPRVGLVLQVSG